MANPVNYLCVFFNCAYCLGMFPFRFQLCPETRKYVIVRNVWQKVRWVIICFLAVVNGLYYAMQDYDLQRNKIISQQSGPDLYFRRVNLLTDAVQFIVIMNTHVAGAEKLEKVFNGLYFSTSYDSKHKNQFHTCWIPLLFVVVGVMLLPMILVYFATESWDFGTGLFNLRIDGISQFFLTRAYISSNGFCTIIFAILRIFTLISYTIFMSSGVLLLLTSSFVVNDCLNCFTRFVDDKDTDSLEVYDEFLALKKITSLLNEALGLLIFGKVFGLLPYFVVTFASFISPENAWEFVIDLLGIVMVYWFLGFAANLGRKANLVMDRFIHKKDLSGLSLFQLKCVLYDINSHFVEFNCAGFCKISPGFVGGMLQLLLTFSVILIQFQTPTEPHFMGKCVNSNGSLMVEDVQNTTLI